MELGLKWWKKKKLLAKGAILLVRKFASVVRHRILLVIAFLLFEKMGMMLHYEK